MSPVSVRVKSSLSPARSLKIRQKVQNLIDELHWKVARFLTDNFDVILLPTFETKQMVSKAAVQIDCLDCALELDMIYEDIPR